MNLAAQVFRLNLMYIALSSPKMLLLLRRNEKRLNKINLRKEFFKVDISELEELVSSIDPTAEFNKTMLAEEFHQSEELSNN